MQERLMSLAAARAAAGGLSESSIRRRIAEGRFPGPVVIARKKSGAAARIAFVESEVLEAVGKMIAEARGASGNAA